MPDNKPNQLPVDPDVKVPAAVKAAAARAEEIHRQAYSPEQGGEQDGGNQPGPSSPGDFVSLAPPERSSPSAAQSGDQLQDQGGERSSSETGGGPQQADTARPDTDWEQRYRSARGRQDQLANENRALAARLAGLEQTLATISAPQQQAQPFNPDLQFRPGPRQVAPPPSKLPTPDQFALSEEERADYGDEFLGVVKKQAAQAMLPYLEQVRQENEQLKLRMAQMGSSVNMSAKQQLEVMLDRELPEWRQLNYDPNFLSWLALTDPYSGVRKQDLLSAAYERNDVGRVLAFFNGFLAEEAAVTPPNAQPNGNGPNGSGGPPKIPLEQFAAPGRAKTAAGGSAPAEKPVISRDQITAFYAQVAAGKFRGQEAEKNRLEGMIFEAQREGRIR